MDRPIERREVRPGAWHLTGFLSFDAQRDLLRRCDELAAGGADFYRPTVRGGGRMRLDVLCLGMHWNATTYRYEPARSDYDARDVPPLPDDLSALACAAASAVGMRLRPDVCIVNRYGEDGKLGVHQDKDERVETLDAGIPIVSLSVGDTGRFVLGGTRRRERVEAIELRSGDAFVMGGPSRLRYHGIVRVLPATAPPDLGYQGRLSLTFRQFAL